MTAPLAQAVVDLKRIEALIPERMRLFGYAFAVELFNEVQSGRKYSPGTPIDTGFHRANWDLAIGPIRPRPAPLTQADAEAQPGAAAAAAGARAREAADTLRTWRPGDPVSMWNTGPAILRLEFGWSQQAREGMIRPAVRNAQAIADDVAAVIARRA